MSDNLPPLLPCPFCGNRANIVMANEKHDHSGGYFIACPACDASTGLRYAMGDDPRPLLVEQWNRRAAIEADLVSRDVHAGWKLVPVEPTDEMILAFAQKECPADNSLTQDIRMFYSAMLAASPQPQPVQPSEAEKFMDAAGLCRRCAAPVADAPIDMVLHCPACGMQHVDAPDEVPDQPILKSAPTTEHPHKMVQVGTYTAQGEWTNPPHRSHLCHGCGHIWRPADVPTNGVAATKTKGKADSPVAQPVQAQPSGWKPIETAPKDGRTMLLGYFNSANKWRTMRGQWMSEDYIAEYWEEPDDVEAGWFETCVEADDPPNCWGTTPTHWMPLPPPPAEQAQKEE